MKKLYFKNASSIFTRYNLLILGALFGLSLIFIYFASFSTSPFYPFFRTGDSAQFQTIGKAWSMGKIPYIEMFDHKGPFIFFVDMLGFLLTGSSSGIAMIQVLFLTVTLMACFLTSRLVSNSTAYHFTVIILLLAALSQVFSDGNLTEEYCLPFLSLSMYFQYKYMISSEQSIFHSPKLAVLYGFSFGVCFLTRVTNGITICVGTLIITCILIRHFQWKNLFENAVGFIGGFMLIFVPFFLYFAIQHGVGDFLYGTIGYNLEYQSHMTSWLISATGTKWSQFALLYFSSYTIFFTALLSFIRKKYAVCIYCLICGICELYLFTSGALYTQYAIVCIPQLVLLMNEIIQIKTTDQGASACKTVLLTGITLFAYVCITSFLPRPADMHNKYNTLQLQGYESLLEQIPDAEKTSFVAYSRDNRFKGIYLLHNLMPYYKYFVIQEWHASFSNYVKQDIHDTFQNGDVKWILTAGTTANISDILNERYELINQIDDYCLYRLRS